jgi:GNAT superfamily N-acetyltransferase
MAPAIVEFAPAHAEGVAWRLAHGIRDVYLGTTERFRAAHRFYEKHGFHEVGGEALPPSFPRMRVDTRFHQRRVQEPR